MRSGEGGKWGKWGDAKLYEAKWGAEKWGAEKWGEGKCIEVASGKIASKHEWVSSGDAKIWRTA